MISETEQSKNKVVRDGIIPSAEWLRENLRYEANTGKLYRLDGTEACATKERQGYLKGSLGNSRCYAHRVIWKLVYGVEPEFIDHINGDKSDNRIQNLRAVTKRDNCRNRRRPSNNTSGVMGVSKYHLGSCWVAHIRYGGSRRLRYFETKQEAIEARRAWERELGFHENHGR